MLRLHPLFSQSVSTTMPVGLEKTLHLLQSFGQIAQGLSEIGRAQNYFFRELGEKLARLCSICDLLAANPMHKIIIKPIYYLGVKEALKVVGEACAKYAQETELINCAETLTQRCEVMRKNYQGCRAKVDQEFMNHYIVADQLQPECAHLKQLMAAVRIVIEDDSTAFFNPAIILPYMSDIHYKRDHIFALEEELVKIVHSLNTRVGVA